MRRDSINQKDKIIVLLLTLSITFMDITGIPATLIFDIQFADVTPYIISLMINFILIGVVAFLVLRLFCTDWKLGFTVKGVWSGLKKYAPAGIAAGLLSAFAFWLGLRPFDYRPTMWKILAEGVLYYIGVGVIEELYVRGLFLNWIEKVFYKSKNKTSIAIIVSSVVFGVGHIPGMIHMGLLVILIKFISTIGMGLYFGTIYKKTGNLMIPIIMHALIDICALPYCFTTFSGYKTISLVCLLIIYFCLGVYSFLLMKNKSTNCR